VIDALTIVAGAACAIAGCQLPRSGAGARWHSSVHVAIDLAFPMMVFVLVAAATARPLFAGVLTFVLCAGYAHSDRSKRSVLSEPIVYTDVFQALDIFRHPSLAVPFPDKLPILCGAAGALILFGSLFVFVPPAWAWTPWPLVASLSAVAAIVVLLRGPLGARAARGLERLRPTADPVADAIAFGPIGMLFVHALLARFERRDVRAEVTRRATTRPQSRCEAGAPLVLIQCESFFDARRLGPALRPGILSGFDELARGGVQWGRLAVPCWGANTVRTEFAVLTGLEQDALGFDRFNPYHRLAREPLDSMASRLKAQGFHTVCLHPFDRRFYGRDRVMPNLGFDEFLGEEAFAGAERVNGFISDAAVAQVACRLIDERGPRLFLFIVTMENHGPWNDAAAQAGADWLAPGAPLSAAERQSLGRYLSSLVHTDAMLRCVADKLSSLERPGTLAAYGDHLPSFASAFAKLALRDHRSDYLIWCRGQSAAAGRDDLAAHELGQRILSVHAGATSTAAEGQHTRADGRRSGGAARR
jgi:hypothetical protein